MLSLVKNYEIDKRNYISWPTGHFVKCAGTIQGMSTFALTVLLSNCVETEVNFRKLIGTHKNTDTHNNAYNS